MWKLLIFFLVLIGFGIAMYSLYGASVSGTMDKMGLVGADFSGSVMIEKLDKNVLLVDNEIKCGLSSRIAQAMSFLISSDDRQGELSFRLGQQRIQCGAQMIAEGSIEAGTYEVLKGIGYLQKGYTFVSERMNVDYRVCKYLPEGDIQTTISTLLFATSDKIYELIFDEWGKVLRLKELVDPVCLSQRQSVR